MSDLSWIHKANPSQQAVIREDECIGCTKCIQACPVDAILGSAKWMHTVISSECTGCELCIAPCPVDCIDMMPRQSIEDKTAHHQQRYFAREERLQKERNEKNSRKIISDRKKYVHAAVLRAKVKKSMNNVCK